MPKKKNEKGRKEMIKTLSGVVLVKLARIQIQVKG
jgi:hypothetical protein